MEVTWATWCESSTSDEYNNTSSITNIFDTAYFRQFPLTTDLHLVTRLEASAAEFGETKHLELRMMDIDATIIFEGGIDITVPQQQPDWRVSWGFHTNIHNLPIEAPGMYVLAILVGGETKYELPLYVEELDAYATEGPQTR